LSLCSTNKHYAVKTYGGLDVCIHVLLISALVGEVNGQLHAPAALPPVERASGTHWIRRLGGPQSQSERREEGKIIDPAGPRTPTSQMFSRYPDSFDVREFQ
jgi:hypothetical protein